MRPIRLLHVIRTIDPSWGGPQAALRSRVNTLDRSEIEVTVASLDDPCPAWDIPGARMAALGSGRGVFGYNAGALDKLRKLAGDHDIAAVSGIWHYHGLAGWLAFRGRIPFILYPHGSLSPMFRRAYPLKHLKKQAYWLLAENRILHDASAVCFTSENERIGARRAFWPYRIREQVIRYGTGAPPAYRGTMNERFLERCPTAVGRPYLLYLSRIHPVKGCDMLLSAFASITLQRPDLLLVMGGPDHVGLVPDLRRQAENLGIGHRVLWPGELHGEAKWGAFYGAEAFCLPSHSENFGIVVAEALACGTPVLISDQVSIHSEVTAAHAGIVGSDTIKGTVQTLTRWLEMGSDERNAMRDAARQCFAEHFDISHANASLVRLLRHILDGRLPPRWPPRESSHR